MELDEQEWSQLKHLIKCARKMVYEDQAYWQDDYKESEARALIKAIDMWEGKKRPGRPLVSEE